MLSSLKWSCFDSVKESHSVEIDIPSMREFILKSHSVEICYALTASVYIQKVKVVASSCFIYII